MKTVLLGLVCALAAWGAGKGKCTSDVRVQWEIKSTYIDGTTPSAIFGDGINGNLYVDGQSGVATAIDVCGGTGDAKLVLNFSTGRDLFVNFANMLHSTPNTPTQVSGPPIGCMNVCWMPIVRNLWYLPAGENRDSEFEFTTHLTGGGPLNSHVVMVNPNVDAVPASSETAANSPHTNSPVHVVHCPANFTGSSESGRCTGGPEQWHVWPESGPGETPNTQVATLLIDRKPKRVSGGEFRIPFYFVITALQ